MRSRLKASLNVSIFRVWRRLTAAASVHLAGGSDTSGNARQILLHAHNIGPSLKPLRAACSSWSGNFCEKLFWSKGTRKKRIKLRKIWPDGRTCHSTSSETNELPTDRIDEMILVASIRVCHEFELIFFWLKGWGLWKISGKVSSRWMWRPLWPCLYLFSAKIASWGF